MTSDAPCTATAALCILRCRAAFGVLSRGCIESSVDGTDFGLERGQFLTGLVKHSALL